MNAIIRDQLHRLAERRILVVEDNFFIADDVRLALEKAGAEVVGPASTIRDAIDHIGAVRVDAAVLDVNLEGEMSYPVAQSLSALEIPFIFASGYDDWAVVSEWRHIPRLQKPYDLRDLVAALDTLLAPQGPL